MNENMAVANDDDEVVFKIKRSAIAEALRSDFEMPIPVTDENIEVVANQITAPIEEFPTGIPTEFFDLGIDHHKGIDFYRKVYGLLDGPRCGTAWASEDSSLVYFAVTDEAGGLTVFHVPSAALAQNMFGSSLGKSLTVQYTGEEDIAPALREARAYCKDAAEKRDPCLIGAMAQASAAKSATAEGEAGGKKL